MLQNGLASQKWSNPCCATRQEMSPENIVSGCLSPLVEVPFVNILYLLGVKGKSKFRRNRHFIHFFVSKPTFNKQQKQEETSI